MDSERKTLLQRWARAAAVTGDHADWRSVQSFLIAGGHADASDLFEDPLICSGIDALCVSAKAKPGG